MAARLAHNQEVAGSNPAPATIYKSQDSFRPSECSGQALG